MKQCFLCRKNVNFFFQYMNGIYDNLTRKRFCLCNQCHYKYSNVGVIDDIRAKTRQLFQNNLLTDYEISEFQKDDARMIADEAKISYTGYIAVQFDNYIFFNEHTQQLVFNYSEHCSFKDIIGYRVLDHSIEYNVQSPENTMYSSNSKNALGRTIAGGLFAGHAGAIMGGLTAQHNISIEKSGSATYQTTAHDFSVVISLKSLSRPSIILSVGSKEVDMIKVTSFLDRIIAF